MADKTANLFLLFWIPMVISFLFRKPPFWIQTRTDAKPFANRSFEPVFDFKGLSRRVSFPDIEGGLGRPCQRNPQAK